MKKRNHILHFVLFGDLLSEEDPDFIHVETIGARSRLYDWRITPHAHQRLFQFVFVKRGGGEVRLDDRIEQVRGPGAITIPSNVVHAFTFEPETTGHVVTVSNLLVVDTTEQRSRKLLEPILSQPMVIDFSNNTERSELVESTLVQMHRELKWKEPGRISIFRWYLRITLMMLRRQMHLQELHGERTGKRLDGFSRFRTLLEEYYRDHWSIPEYARRLAVSPSKLNRMCRLFAGKAALDLVHDRLVLEAQRLLLYTDATAATIADEIGFKDPAYFSRFFRARTGTTPLNFRKSSRRDKRSKPIMNE